MNDAIRQRLVASASRARLAFALLAIVVPLALHLLFARQERRLRALADHGRATTAVVTHVTRGTGGHNTHYRYEVDGHAYTWNVAYPKAPFARGMRLPITYLPEDPSLSRPVVPYAQDQLLGELNRPVRMGFPIGLLVFFGGAALLSHRSVVRLRRGEPLRTKPLLSPAAAGRLVAILLLAVVIGVNFDPKVRATQTAAFGATPLGLPVSLVVTVVELLLFAPWLWVFPHLMRIVMDSQRRGGSLTKGGIVMAVWHAGPEWRRSKRIVVGGFLYFVAIVAGWIAFAAWKGI
jgi:hypothetical protein